MAERTHAQLDIDQALDVASLAVLTPAEAEAADEDGILAGNQHYQDLQACNIEDLRFVLDRERKLVESFLDSNAPAAAEASFEDDRPLDDDRDALWHLDVGMASAVVALVALGAHPTLSCNGGCFGGCHNFPAPLIKAYIASASPDTLLALAKVADIGVRQEEGLIVLYANDCDAFMRFGEQALSHLTG